MKIFIIILLVAQGGGQSRLTHSLEVSATSIGECEKDAALLKGAVMLSKAEPTNVIAFCVPERFITK